MFTRIEARGYRCLRSVQQTINPFEVLVGSNASEWADSPHVAKEIGWSHGSDDLRAWLINQGLLERGQSKPADPKSALEKALRKTKKPRASAIYQAIAREVSFQRCTDSAFLKFRTTLQTWFPQP